MDEPVAANQTIVGRSIMESSSMFLVCFLFIYQIDGKSLGEIPWLLKLLLRKRTRTTKLAESRNEFSWMIDGVSNEKLPETQQDLQRRHAIRIAQVNKLGFDSKNFLQSNNETRSSWQRTGHKRSVSSNNSCHENLHAPIIGHFRNKLRLLNIVTWSGARPISIALIAFNKELKSSWRVNGDVGTR